MEEITEALGRMASGWIKIRGLSSNFRDKLFPYYEDWTQAPIRTLRYEAKKLVARFNKEGWTTEEKMKVQSGPEGQTTLLTTPIVIQPCISSIEDKVVDEKGEPIPNVKIVANQKHPIHGYKQFETVTDSDGTFSFNKLMGVGKPCLHTKGIQGLAV